MIVKNAKKENNSFTFDVELDAAEFEKFVNGAYLKAKSKISVPGFRKGKASRMVIEGMYGKEVFYEDAIDDAANPAFSFGVTEEKLNIVGAPSLLDAKVTDEKGLVISFKTDLYPEVTLGEYKGLSVEKETVTVTAEEIDTELQMLRKQSSRMVTAERAAQNGDVANIDFCGKLNGVAFEGGTGENHDLKLGSGSFVPGFEEQVVGMKAGEEKDIDITFPENYHENLAGKAVVFTVKCNEVKFEELPEVDDEFAKDNGFDTLDELKADLEKKITSRKQTAADNAFTDAAVDAAVANMTVDIPASMIEERMDSMIREYAQYMAGQGMDIREYIKMTGSDIGSFRESTRPTAEKQTRTELLLAAVAKAENLEITDEELEKEYEEMGKAYNMSAEDVKKAINPEGLKEDMLRQKAMKVITESAVAAAPKKASAKKTAAKKAAPKAEEGEEAPKPKKTATKKAAPKANEGEEAPKPKKTTAKKAAPKAE